MLPNRFAALYDRKRRDSMGKILTESTKWIIFQVLSPILANWNSGGSSPQIFSSGDNMTNLSSFFPKTSYFFILILLFTDFSTAQANQYYKKTLEKYEIPNVTLLNQNGESVHLTSYLETDKPILLDFIYGTCTTICPVLSAGFSHFQKKMGEDVDKVQLLSISIDPDNDSPEIMLDYLIKYRARPGWDTLTGNRAHIIQVLKEFDAYVSNKMDHFPLTLLWAPGEEKWIRLYGMLSASDLMKEYQQLIKKE